VRLSDMRESVPSSIVNDMFSVSGNISFGGLRIV